MAHINQIDNFNLINFNNLPLINNERVEPWNVDWVIDRRPDPNLINIINNRNEYDDINFINNLQNNRNNHFQEQFPYATQALMNGLIQFQHNIDHDDDDLPADDNIAPHNAAPDDFIPFEPQPQPLNHIVIDVQTFPISEEDCNCCVYIKTKQNDQICQFNCLHKFCSECTLTHFRRNRQRTSCPLCRTPVTNISVQTQALRETFI
jgi:hypothetical protein